MEYTKPGSATKATVARPSDPSVVSHGLVSLLSHRVLPADRDGGGHRSYPPAIEIADFACFHATPWQKEQKELVDLRCGFSFMCRATALLTGSLMLTIFAYELPP